MPFIPVPNVAKVSAGFDQDGQSVANVMHFRKVVPDPFNETDLRNLITSYETHWTAEISPLQSNGVTNTVIQARALDEDFSPAVEQDWTGFGTFGPSELPTNVTFTIKWPSGLAGRSRRGRTYHVGLPGSVVINSRVDATYMADLQDAYENFQALMLGDGWQMVVVSYVSNGVPRTEGLVTVLAAPVLVDNIVDSQRRRLPGRGN